MPPRPDPNPKTYSHRQPVQGTPYYKERKVQPGFPGYTSNTRKPTDVKRQGMAQALQNASRKFGTTGKVE